MRQRNVQPFVILHFVDGSYPKIVISIIRQYTFKWGSETSKDHQIERGGKGNDILFRISKNIYEYNISDFT